MFYCKIYENSCYAKFVAFHIFLKALKKKGGAGIEGLQGFAVQGWPLGSPGVLQPTVLDVKVFSCLEGAVFIQRRSRACKTPCKKELPTRAKICYSLTAVIRNNLITGLTPQYKFI